MFEWTQHVKFSQVCRLVKPTRLVIYIFPLLEPLESGGLSNKCNLPVDLENLISFLHYQTVSSYTYMSCYMILQPILLMLVSELYKLLGISTYHYTHLSLFLPLPLKSSLIKHRLSFSRILCLE